MRAIARNVAYANKCVTLEVLRHGTSSKDTVRDRRKELELELELEVEVEVEEEEPKRPRQVGGRETMRSNVHLSLGIGECRNLGRLNLRQLPLPHHRRTLSPMLLLSLHAVGSRRHRHRCGSSFSSLPKREARRRDATRRSVRHGVNEP